MFLYVFEYFGKILLGYVMAIVGDYFIGGYYGGGFEIDLENVGYVLGVV